MSDETKSPSETALAVAQTDAAAKRTGELKPTRNGLRVTLQGQLPYSAGKHLAIAGKDDTEYVDEPKMLQTTVGTLTTRNPRLLISSEGEE